MCCWLRLGRNPRTMMLLVALTVFLAAPIATVGGAPPVTRTFVPIGSGYGATTLQRFALAAAQQSKNNRIAQVESCKGLREVLAESDAYDLKLIPALIGKRRTLKEVLTGRNPGNILVLIGPEGDFTPRELQQAEESGCLPITLGESILRVETAAVAVASFIRLYAER